jgi:integrase/recombinase XerD
MASLKFDSKNNRWRIWWHVTTPSGTVYKGSKVVRGDKKSAEKFLGRVEEQEERWRSGEEIPEQAINTVKTDWLNVVKVKYTNRTYGLYSDVIDRFTESLPAGILNVIQLQPKHISDYLVNLGRSNRTYNCHLTVIKSFCRFFSEMYDIPNPSAKVKMIKEEEAVGRFLTKTEYETALKHGDEYFKSASTFIANTGLRATEMCELKWLNIDHSGKSMQVVGKGNKKRTVPLNEAARKALESIKQQGSHTPNTHIFISKSSKPYTRFTLYLLFSGVAKTAKLTDFGPHSLRHYFATQLLLAGVPIIKVSAILGHESVSTTQHHYSHILAPDLAGITDVLG